MSEDNSPENSEEKAEAAPEEKAEAAPEESQNDYQPKRIMIIEDDIDVSFIMKKRLGQLRPNDEVYLEKTLYKGLSALKQHPCHMIFLDLNLPDSFGISTIKDVRKYLKKTPIVVTTGMAGELTVEEAKKAGANEIIVKSNIDKAFLVKIMEKYIGMANMSEAEREAILTPQ
jgi:response regulator of citrate/malate metabolism